VISLDARGGGADGADSAAVPVARGSGFAPGAVGASPMARGLQEEPPEKPGVRMTGR